MLDEALQPLRENLMKKSLAFLDSLFVSVALTTLLAACGGGDADDDAPPAPSPGSATPVPPPASNPPPAPVPAGTGLSLPTLRLTLNAEDAVLLAKKMVDAGDQAAGAVATLALGPLDPGVSGAPSPLACPGGGTLGHVDAGAGVQAYTYTGCASGPYTFNGSSTFTPSMTAGVLTSFTLAFDGLLASGAGSPPSLTGTLNCLAPTAAGAAPACTSTFAHIVWGRDTVVSAAGVSGTHQCSCSQGSWNVTFDAFNASSGKAFVYATNGTADVTRTGPKTFTVVLAVEGVTKAFSIVLS